MNLKAVSTQPQIQNTTMRSQTYTTRKCPCAPSRPRKTGSNKNIAGIRRRQIKFLKKLGLWCPGAPKKSSVGREKARFSRREASNKLRCRLIL